MNELPAPETAETPTLPQDTPAPAADAAAQLPTPVAEPSAAPAPTPEPTVFPEPVDQAESTAIAPQTQTHAAATPTYREKALAYVRENPNAVIFGGGIVFLLLVLWLVARARKAELGLFRNASGRVSVSRNALADLVETVARGVPGTVKPRAFFRKRGGLVNVKLRLRLKGRRRLTGFVNDVQERITMALRDALGEEQIGQVDVVVTGFYDLGTREQPVEDNTSAEVEENMKDLI